MKKLLSLTLCLLMVSALIAGCTPSQPVDTAPADNTPVPTEAAPVATDAPAEPVAPAEPIPVEFWSTWTGTGGETIQAMVDDFNATQSQYVVSLVYNGGYTDSWAKFISLPKTDWPELVYMNAEIISTLMFNEICTPVQKFVDEDAYDLSDIQASLLGHYSDNDGNLLMMPMGNTMVGFFYNADLCAEAGVDPYALTSIHDFVEASRKIKEATGCPTPFAMGRNPIYYTFLYTAQGLKGLDNDNGRAEFPTTSLVGTSPLKECTADYLTSIQTLSAEGLMAPFSGSTQDFIDLFSQEQVCFMFFTCSSTTAINNTVNGAFEFGFLPAPAASQGSTVLSTPTGGGGVFIPDNGDTDAQRGGWEFLKFISQPKYTSAFARATGYLPITKSTVDDPDYAAYMTDVFKTAQYCMDAQAKSVEEYSYTPAWPSGMDYATYIYNAIDTVMADPNANIDEVVETLQANLQDQLDIVNMAR